MQTAMTLAGNYLVHVSLSRAWRHLARLRDAAAWRATSIRCSTLQTRPSGKARTRVDPTTARGNDCYDLTTLGGIFKLRKI